MTPATAHLYGILDLGYVRKEEAALVAKKMLEAGIGILQLRAKGYPIGDILSLGKLLAPLCRNHDVPFILNDYPELVEEVGADGAHVGQDDISVAEARRLAGSHAIIGKSTHSVEQALKAVGEAPDYLGFGPLFATATKPDYTPIGILDIARVHELVSLPIFCIGGIKRENLPTVISAGARRVVIVSGILQAPDIGAYCNDCLKLLR